MVISIAARERFKAIHLVRSNYLKTLVSRLTAARSDIYHATKPIEVEKIHLVPESVFAELAKIRNLDEAWRLRIRKFDRIEIKYDGIARHPDVEGIKICEFLRVDSKATLKPDLVKINPDNLGDIIENYDEIAKLLTRTEFAYCLQN